MTDLTCEEFHSLSAELALGVLEGRERAEALAHVERCTACQRELAAMGDVADRLIELTPSAQPPAGFETQVLSRLTARSTVRRRRGVARSALLAVAAAVVAVVGVGGWAIGHDGGSAPSVAAGPSLLRSATFVAGDRPIGQVIAYGGSHPWLAVAVDSDLGNQVVRCELLERNGTTVTVGDYSLTAGDGYWGSAVAVAPSLVDRVRLVDATGRAIATATFSSRPTAAR